MLNPLPMLWASSTFNPSYAVPVEVIVKKNPVIVNKTLLNESPLLSFLRYICVLIDFCRNFAC